MISFKNTRGSVLIWTMTLGMIMTSVFLAMALRLNRNMSLRRETLDTLQQQAYLESYLDYIKQLKQEEQEQLKVQGIDYDGIKGVMSNEVHEWREFLDQGQSFSFPLNGIFKIEWNTCLQGLLRENGRLEVNPAFMNPVGSACGSQQGAKYHHWGIVQGVNDTLVITSTGEPTHLRISEAQANQPFPGREWRLELKMKTPYSRVLRAREIWENKAKEE